MSSPSHHHHLDRASSSSSSRTDAHSRLRRRPNAGTGARGSTARGGGFHFDGETLRRFREVSKRAALAGKRKIWDTNDDAVTIAQSAVDQWEHAYFALRSVLIASARSAASTYGAVKSAAGGIEHHLLVPVRDVLILPAFVNAEMAVGGAVGFVQSEEARRLAGASLGVVKSVPLVGESVLAPAFMIGAECMKNIWMVAQYPIPSRSAVRNTVDGALTVTKLALRNTAREIYYYMKLIDATITRTMLHTQWRVLGSGPYSSLDPCHKAEVLDHICERYFALSDAHPVARYELAAHIKAKNPALYDDLVMSGLLICRAREAGGNAKDDAWLMTHPSYRTQERPLLLPQSARTADFATNGGSSLVQPLWFHLPYHNGKRPGKDFPWVRFSTEEGDQMEQGFVSFLESVESAKTTAMGGVAEFPDFGDVMDELSTDFDDAREEQSVESTHPPTSGVQSLYGDWSPEHIRRGQEIHLQDEPESRSWHQHTTIKSHNLEQYPTKAQWYEPDLSTDVLIDQKRYAVTFLPACAACGIHEATKVPSNSSCKHHNSNTAIIPPVKMVMRPTLWRFHGPHSNDVRRAVWLLDTKRNGLQPYSDESAAVLEDAYLFLKYNFSSRAVTKETEMGIEGVLLSVEVPGPDGEEQLVQFWSLTQVTAIHKTLGGAFAVFKRRVYRGATRILPQDDYSGMKENPLHSREDESDPTAQDFKMRRKAIRSNNPGFKQSEQGNLDEIDLMHPNICLAAPLDDVSQQQGHKKCPKEGSDNIEHLILVVHGIGEMLRSVDVFGMGLPALCSIVDCCSWLRKNHAEVHAAQFSDFREVNRESPASSVMGRVEYIPVEWHEAFSLQSQRFHSDGDKANYSKPSVSKNGGSTGSSTTLKDISLKTIPALRDFANDTLLDVLYFMSPHHHSVLIDIVAKEMHLVVSKFRKLTEFKGKISILGHSLGSVITWDILANQFPSSFCHSRPPQTANKYAETGLPSDHLGMFTKSRQNDDEAEYPQLDFEVHNFFMLGSPVAVFLMIRNQNGPLSEEFCLPGCNRVFNIFHPYDPAAYRIEPLIDPRNSDADPKIITHWKGGFRVQYQTKFMLKKLVDETRKTQKNVIEAVEAGMVGIGLLDATVDDLMEEEGDELSSVASDDSFIRKVYCGALNQGRRIDFMLQEKEIENANEYVFALAAHSSYWKEKDLSLFIARQIFRSRSESEDGEFVTGPVQGVSARAAVASESPDERLLYGYGTHWSASLGHHEAR